jgi:glycosyltransferase involved in cell wall biosynthesis
VSIAKNNVDNIILHVHNANYDRIFRNKYTRKLSYSLEQNVDCFIFAGERISEKTSKFIPKNKRHIVRNTIDECVKVNKKRVTRIIKNRSTKRVLRITYLSRMNKVKGYMDLARAAVKLSSSSQDIAFCVEFIGGWVGGGEWAEGCRGKKEFVEFLQENDLIGQVEMHGAVTDRKKIKNCLLKADIFVLPTYHPTETQPIAIIEAMNAGTPVIATSHATIPEYVIDDHNGYLVGKKAPGEIAEAICKLDDLKNWKEKARAARKTYEDMFSPSAVQSQLDDALSVAESPEQKGRK